MSRISIVIPVRPGDFPRKSLESLKQIELKEEVNEVIIAYGNYPSRQRNVAVNTAGGDIIYFLDDDSQVPPDTIMKLNRRFLENNVDVIGGPSIPPPDDSFIQQCFAECFASPFGGFNIRHRHKKSGKFRPATERELISCNLAIRREVYIKEGGMNETLYPNEENEFLDRLHSKGYKLFYDPELFVFRSMRKSFIEFSRQIFTYGRGRMDQTFVNPVFIKIYHFVPLVFVLYLSGFIFFHFTSYFIPLLPYLFLNFLFSSIVAVDKRSIKFIFLMPVVFLICHVSYGLGSLWGLIKKLFFVKKNHPIPEISIEILKL